MRDRRVTRSCDQPPRFRSFSASINYRKLIFQFTFSIYHHLSDQHQHAFHNHHLFFSTTPAEPLTRLWLKLTTIPIPSSSPKVAGGWLVRFPNPHTQTITAAKYYCSAISFEKLLVPRSEIYEPIAFATRTQNQSKTTQKMLKSANNVCRSKPHQEDGEDSETKRENFRWNNFQIDTDTVCAIII